MRAQFVGVVLLGFISIKSYVRCQQGSNGERTNLDSSPLLSIAALEKEIARFETKQSRGHTAAHTGSGHSHREPQTKSQDANAHSHHHSSDHQTNSVNTVQTSGEKGKGHITDIHGNRPPHPGGFHVDLPNEHGNTKPHPVLHFGSDPISPHSHDDHASQPADGIPDIAEPPKQNDINARQNGLSIPDGISSPAAPIGIQSMAVSTFPDRIISGQGISIPDGQFSGIGISIPDGHSSGPLPNPTNVNADLGSHHDGPDKHHPPPPTVPNPHQHQGHQPTHNNVPGHGPSQVHPPGVHGNNLPVSVIHRPHGPNSNPHPVHGPSHVDPPGVHGNNLPVSVIHRPHRPNPNPHPGHGPSHVDPPGVHGNNLPVSVIHRPHRPNPNPHPGHGPSHVDPPGVHGNNLPVSVIHRPHRPNSNQHPDHGPPHVDPPGVHGNNLPVSVIHRPHRPNPNPHPGHGPSHVDPPGVHGNNLPVSVIHRPHRPNPNPHPGHGPSHVDPPGVHGNNLPVSVIHRPHRPNPNPHPDHGQSHVDPPGVHGNNLPVSVIHRPHRPNPNPHPDHGPSHVDAPGVHGNNLPVSVIHRPHGPNPSPHSGHGPSHVDQPGVNGNNFPVSVIHRPHTPNPRTHPGDGPSHVVPPGVHNHNLPVSVIHRPHGPNPRPHPGHEPPHVDAHGANKPHQDHQALLDNSISHPHGLSRIHDINTPDIDHLVGPVGLSRDQFSDPPLHLPDGSPIAFPARRPKLQGSHDHLHGEPTASLLIQTGAPLDPLNKLALPGRRRRNRLLRRLSRRLPKDGTLLSDVLRMSEVLPGKSHISDGLGHIHTHHSRPRFLTIRRRPALSGILGSLLGSIDSSGSSGPRPIRLRLSRAPSSRRDLLGAVGSQLIGMVIDRIASG